MNSQDNNLTLAGIIGQIAAFDRKCKREEFTDTGDVWELLYAIKSDLKRVISPPKPRKVKITNGKEAKIVCPKCGPVVPMFSEAGYTVTHDLESFNKKTGIVAHAWDGNSSKISEEGSGYILECPKCGDEWPLPEGIEIEWL